MAEMNVEMLKEALYKVSKALFCISETCVDVSKQHISEKDALDKIRNYLYDTDIIGSRYRVDRLIEECMKPVVSNGNYEFNREYLGKWIGLEPLEINYPDCCDGCSNNPRNGGSGICSCTLPYMQDPIMYNTGDSCMANNIDGNVYFITNVDDLANHRAERDRIEKAIENISKYIKG